MKLLLLLCVLSIGFFALFPHTDIDISSLFFGADKTFIYKNHPLVLFVYDVIPVFTKLLVLFLVVQLALQKFKSSWKKHLLTYCQTTYLFLVLIVGPGILVHNVIKETVGRPRPNTIVEFGGTLPYQPPIAISDAGGKSFVSGHASMGFYVVAFALISKSRKSKIAWYGAGIIGGSMVGLGRMLQGRHFFSDVWFSGLIVLLTAHLLYYLLFTMKQKNARN
jgi:lipid A 4'-phosphatase